MSIQETKLTEIADAIRAVDGTTEPIVANDFATRILATLKKSRFGELVDRSIEVIAPSEMEGITKIKEFILFDCYNLASIIIPDSVTIIGSNAFHYCTGLTSIIIPNSVTSIENYAFTNLGPTNSSVYVALKATIPPILGYDSFGGRTYKIHLPASAEIAYSTATGWSALYTAGRLVFDL